MGIIKVIHIYNGILWSHEGKWMWVSWTEADEPRAGYTEWSKSEREKQISYINAHLCSLEIWYKWACSQGRNRDPVIEDRHVAQRGKGRVNELGEEHWHIYAQFSSVAQSCPTLCDPMDCSTWPPCPSPTHGVYPNSCPLSQWCHLAISSSVIPFFSCLQSFPASGSFQMSQLFASGGQSIGVSASGSVLPMNTQDWPHWQWTGWISLKFKRLSRVFSNITVQKHQFFSAQLSL